MRPRPTEVRLIRDMLTSEEWEDETECAEAILARLDDMRGRDRDYYVLAVQHPTSAGIATLMYGPYATLKEAERAYRKGTGQVSDLDKVGIFKMTTPQRAAEALSA